MDLYRVLTAVLIALLVVLACSSPATPTPIPTPTPTPTPTPRIWPFSDSDGAWSIDVEKNPGTDKEKIAAYIRPRRSVASTWIGLVARCGYSQLRDDEAEVVVIFADELEDKRFTEVQYQFDDEMVETENWWGSTERDALFSPSASEFVWRIMNSEELSIREEGGQTLMFNTPGLANVLFPHRDKCNWIQPE